MKPSSQVVPAVKGTPVLGCILCTGFGWTKATDGKLPEFRSELNELRSRMVGDGVAEQRIEMDFPVEHSCRIPRVALDTTPSLTLLLKAGFPHAGTYTNQMF